MNGFKLDDLEIPREMLYDKADAQTCVLRVVPEGSDNRNSIILGFHLLKRFHLEIVYGDSKSESWAVFSKRTPRYSMLSLTGCDIC